MVFKPKGNHRDCSRTPLDLAVTLYHRRGTPLDCKLVDISFGGAYIQADSATLAIDEPVTLALLLRSGRQEQLYSMSAVVVRKNEEGAGLMFDEYDRDTIHCLRQVYREALN